ncbi:MAG: NAD(+)/NADH kinase [Deltaproteobacteria bacterium]|nr:NAD(+)/NADH kinase [Deltaproteobacteria bacterium]
MSRPDTLKKIGIVANVNKGESSEYTSRLREWFRKQGREVFLEKEIAADCGDADGLDMGQLAARTDLIVVFGGDGTMLRTARSVTGFNIPIVGINLGGFGYLTEVNLGEMYGALEMILKGEYRTEKRMMLDVQVYRGRKKIGEGCVLNDAVINRGNLSRIVELETAVDGQYLTTYKADGIIVSTPTGSTAYSLAAGGPIVFPEEDSIIINPICPHTLTNRPVILPRDCAVKVVLWTKEKGATLTLDGQVSFTLMAGDAVTIKKSHYITTLVASPHRNYLEILRTKLGWGGLPAGTGKKTTAKTTTP